MAAAIVRDDAAELVTLLSAARKRAHKLRDRLRNSRRYEYASALAQLTDGAFTVAQSIETDVTPGYADEAGEEGEGEDHA